MRIRSTKPEFWRSKTIAELSWDVRLVLKGIESYVDDNGVGKDDLALIAADVFPRDLSRDPRETLARLSEAITALTSAGIVVRYTFTGEDLLYVDKWKDIQRIDKPGKGRFPRPDGTLEYSEVVNRESYGKSRDTLASPPETLAPGTGEQGNRGTEEQGNRGAGSGGSATEVCHQGAEKIAPPEKCDRHKDLDKPPSCGACAAARRAREAWDRSQANAADAEKRRLADANAARLAAIKACPECDHNGLVTDDDGTAHRCTHPRLADTA
ncbi:MAG: hypothetical protein K2Y33_03280 [Mycolicibacterium frederiksbergense]|nr:hypothetical protein [Mycolicibacterium frederiksbergense]